METNLILLLTNVIIPPIVTTLFYIWSFNYGYEKERKELLEKVETYRKQKQDLKDFIKIQLKTTEELNGGITQEQINTYRGTN